jgi:DNA modification methylase
MTWPHLMTVRNDAAEHWVDEPYAREDVRMQVRTIKCFRCGDWFGDKCSCKDGQAIFHGDCREILPELPKVDLVLTDPPYGVAHVTSWRLRTDKKRHPIQNDKDLSVVADAWPLVVDRMKDDTHWYGFASPRMIPEAEQIFGKTKHILAWDKGDRGTVGDLDCGFGEAWEAIFYGMNGRRPLNGKRPRTVIRFDWSSTMDPVHPTVKPVPLLRRMVEWSTSHGETVLDPFMGSGTTLRACKDLGRRGIGIEIEEKYCEIAANRLRQEVLF